MLIVYNKAMKKYTGNRGFIRKVIIIVVALCAAFLLLSVVASNSPLANLGPGSSLSNFVPTIDNAPTTYKTNPLLDFGDGSSYAIDYSSQSRSVPNTDGKGTSIYSDSVSFSAGNTTTSQPAQEYMVLRNYGDRAIDITGWSLSNSKGSRPIQTSGNSYVYPSADVAVIGQGTEFLNPAGGSNIGDIVLKPGDSAYITTGQAFAQFPFPIATSFRENICQGYLEDYPFFPSLSKSCPALINDPQIKTVTDECYDYISSFYQSCPNPARADRKTYDKQPSHCRAFIEARVGYPACVAQNGNISGFSLRQWRIFLGQKKEMWASQRETITLYDKKGAVVSQVSY